MRTSFSLRKSSYKYSRLCMAVPQNETHPPPCQTRYCTMPSLKSLGLGSHIPRGYEIMNSDAELRKLSEHDSGTVTVVQPDGSQVPVNTLDANMLSKPFEGAFCRGELHKQG